jgi:predicted Zn-dependent protease
MILALLSMLLAGPDVWTYWIQPCSVEAAKESGCQAGDPQLGIWALEAWQRAAPQVIAVKPAESEQTARLRIYWASGRSQLYGEARPILVKGQRGAEVYVLPQAARAGEDALMRDTVVYLTCLHESGHGLGLAHTRQFEDIMYSFQFGGDITEYFGRFRRQLTKRDDIAKHAGMSGADRDALLLLYVK